MKTKIEFPQPLVSAPAHGAHYYYDADGKPEQLTWQNDRIDQSSLRACNCYATREEAQQRGDWNAQEMARLVIPEWFRALGPDVELRYAEGWIRANGPSDWSAAKPADYRAKPRDVVVTVNGKEYRWPPCVEEGAPIGPRHCIYFTDRALCESAQRSAAHGNRTHHTREGAQAQADALNAVLKWAM